MSDVFYHKECSKCHQCGACAGSDTGMVLGPLNRYIANTKDNLVIYCQGCFDKIQKVTVFSIADAITIIHEQEKA